MKVYRLDYVSALILVSAGLDSTLIYSTPVLLTF